MHKDRPAMCEAQFPEQVLHDLIVSMSVDPQMPALPVCPVDAEASDSRCVSAGGDPVHHSVSSVADPRAVLDPPVCGFNIFPGYKIKYAQDLFAGKAAGFTARHARIRSILFAAADAHIAVPAADIFLDQLPGRPLIWSPLIPG